MLLMGKSTINALYMVIFNSKLLVYQRVVMMCESEGFNGFILLRCLFQFWLQWVIITSMIHSAVRFRHNRMYHNLMVGKHTKNNGKSPCYG